MLKRGMLYLHTARRLRWTQWVYRPVRRLQARLPAPSAPTAAPALDEARIARLAAALAAAGPGDAQARRARAAAVASGRFEFLGQAVDLPVVDWRRRHVSHLWSYNLQYFDYAVDLAWAWRLEGDPRYPRCFQALAEGWMQAAAGGRGDAWEPYPASLRVVNWSYAYLLFGDALPAEFRGRLAGWLHAQLGWVQRRLEWHVLANHLQKNLHALATGWLLFAGGEAQAARSRALRLLWRELREQVLDDGGHYERSPMYHAIALADFLELALLMDAAGEPVPAAARERIGRMAGAWPPLSHPDGTPALFNDAAAGIAPPDAWIATLAERVLGAAPVRPRGAWALPRTGYYGWEDAENGTRIVVDCGPPAVEYQPGHAHCDLLSFELDLAGRPVVVDSGVHGYDGDPYREYVRSSRAHNTLMVDGREQSEVWGTFRLARPARVLDARAGEAGGLPERDRTLPLSSRGLRGEGDGGWETPRAGEAEGGWMFEGAYAPYHDAGVAHRRELRLSDGRCTVTDRVDGAVGRPVASFLHLHPDFTAEVRDGRMVAQAEDVTIVVEPFGWDRVRVARGETDPVQGWHCPRFGRALAAPVLVMESDAWGGGPAGYVIRVDGVGR